MNVSMGFVTALVFALPLAAAGAAAPSSASTPGRQARPLPRSAGLYRLPFADGTEVKVFDDFTTHRPVGRVDLFAVGGHAPYRVVAAAAGRIVAIQDGYSEQQSGRAAADCHNNYVWIEHPNGEWTNYSHLAHDSLTGRAGLHVGDQVKAGQYLGDEGAVGCAMLNHVHFEVAMPEHGTPIDAGGFLLDNEDSRRERNPRFCGVAGETVTKDATYRAVACPAAPAPAR
jgi:murein DD-endopeptidase MepM/ murein hydrolase activator NlpD